MFCCQVQTALLQPVTRPAVFSSASRVRGSCLTIPTDSLSFLQNLYEEDGSQPPVRVVSVEEGELPQPDPGGADQAGAGPGAEPHQAVQPRPALHLLQHTLVPLQLLKSLVAAVELAW